MTAPSLWAEVGNLIGASRRGSGTRTRQEYCVIGWISGHWWATERRCGGARSNNPQAEVAKLPQRHSFSLNVSVLLVGGSYTAPGGSSPKDWAECDKQWGLSATMDDNYRDGTRLCFRESFI